MKKPRPSSKNKALWLALPLQLEALLNQETLPLISGHKLDGAYIKRVSSPSYTPIRGPPTLINHQELVEY
jgi:hypothetical protein